MEFYIRTQDGQTYNVETLREALTILVGANGYRLSIRDQEHSDVEVVMRRYAEFIPDSHLPNQLECSDVNVVVRGL